MGNNTINTIMEHNTPQQSFTIKARRGEDVRRWTTVTPPQTMSQLHAQLNERFGLCNSSIKYADEDEDMITLATDADVEEWLAAHNGHRLYLEVGLGHNEGEGSSGVAAAACEEVKATKEEAHVDEPVKKATQEHAPLSVRELKARLAALGVPYADCCEKRELLERYNTTKHTQDGKPTEHHQQQPRDQHHSAAAADEQQQQQQKQQQQHFEAAAQFARQMFGEEVVQHVAGEVAKAAPAVAEAIRNSQQHNMACGAEGGHGCRPQDVAAF